MSNPTYFHNCKRVPCRRAITVAPGSIVVRCLARDDPRWFDVPDFAINLIPALSENGFVAASVHFFGTRMNAEIAWGFHDKYEGWQKILAGNIEYQTRAGLLGTGKWRPIHWNESIEACYWGKLRLLSCYGPSFHRTSGR